MNECKTLESVEPEQTKKSSQEMTPLANTPAPAVMPIFDKKRYQHDAFGKSIFRDVCYTKEIVKWICRGHQALLDVLDVDQIEVCPESFF